MLNVDLFGYLHIKIILSNLTKPMNKKNDDILNQNSENDNQLIIEDDDDKLECYCNLCVLTNNMGKIIFRILPNHKFFQNPYVFGACFILIFLGIITLIFSLLFGFLVFIAKLLS